VQLRFRSGITASPRRSNYGRFFSERHCLRSADFLVALSKIVTEPRVRIDCKTRERQCQQKRRGTEVLSRAVKENLESLCQSNFVAFFQSDNCLFPVRGLASLLGSLAAILASDV